MKMVKALVHMFPMICIGLVLFVMATPVLAAWTEDQIRWAQGVLRENGFYRGTEDGRWSAELEQALQAATRDFEISKDYPKDMVDDRIRLVLSFYNNRYEYDLAMRKTSKALAILPTLPPPGSYTFVERWEVDRSNPMISKYTWSFFPDGKCQNRHYTVNEASSRVWEAVLLGRCQLVKWTSQSSTPVLFFWVAHQSGGGEPLNQECLALYRQGGAKNMPIGFSFDQYGKNLVVGGKLHEKTE